MNTFRLPAETRISQVQLRTRDLVGSARFYGQVLGLQRLHQQESILQMGAPGAAPFLKLVEDRTATPRPARTTGLYHVAIRFPDRRGLAHALQRLVLHRWSLDGASHHRVSEALYLSDPEGNGVELYADLPRSQWKWRDGQVVMATEALDLQDLLATTGGESALPALVPAGTDLGHIHLHVAALPEAEHFFHAFLGFDVTQRSYPGALFFSAGGYHHHIAANTWAGRASAPPTSSGLLSYRLEVPDADWIALLKDRARQFNIAIQERDGAAAFTVRDTNGTCLEIVARQA